MSQRLARTACAIAALVMSGTALGTVVNVGTIKQIAPRPLLSYNGGFAPYISSSLVQNGVDRTLVAIDIYGIMQAAGLTHLERIDILDGGGNAYGGSPGADIDYFLLQGMDPQTVQSLGYTGTNPVHVG